MALVSLVDDPHLNIDKGHAYAVLLWDLAAAFDTVDHANLLSHFVAEVNFRRWALEQFKVLLDKKKCCYIQVIISVGHILEGCKGYSPIPHAIQPLHKALRVNYSQF